MPVVLRDGPYRFLFYGSDQDEPPHVHVERDRMSAKFWLEPTIILAKNHGFRPHELNKVERLVELHRDYLLEAWHAFFRR